METKDIFNLRTRKQTSKAIYGNHSIRPVYATNEVISFFGDVEETFHRIKEYQNKNMLPRMGSESKPLTMRDLELYNRNVELGHRHWQWIQKQGGNVRESTGYDSVWGYGYETDSHYIIVNSDDSIEFSIVS